MDSIQFTNEKVLMRVDFNVPLNKEHQITDDTRIRAALPTIKKVINEGGSVILMSHLGRPKIAKNGQADVDKFTLKHLIPHLSELLGVEVQFSPQTVGAKANAMATNLKPGEVLLVENTRFEDGETKGDTALAEAMSELGSLYINDAFGTAHRAHASTAVVAQYFPAGKKAFGYLMEAEIANASKVLNNPDRPFTAILGGAKVSDKIQLIDKLLEVCDNILIGGGMGYTFSKATGGKIGNSICEDDYLELAIKLLEKAESKGVNIHLPQDLKIADSFSNDANTQFVNKGEIPDGWEGLDIGPKTIESFSDVVLKSKTIIWNGPQGVFEFPSFAAGTNAIAQSVAKATQENNAFSLIGGGDSVSAINKSGLADQVSFISTGGGAMLEFLEGKNLPGIKAIKG